MFEAFRLGGWGMFPTLFSGLFLLWVASSYARKREAAQLPLLAILALLTMAAGCLGFVTGFMKTLEFASSAPNWVEAVTSGTFESLHNLALAFSFLVLSGIVASIGAWRSKRVEVVPSRIPVNS